MSNACNLLLFSLRRSADRSAGVGSQMGRQAGNYTGPTASVNQCVQATQFNAAVYTRRLKLRKTEWCVSAERCLEFTHGHRN